MIWLTIKTFFKKARATIAKYWHYFALGLYTIVMVYLFKKNKNVDGVINAFKLSKESHQKEIEAINDAHQEELAKRDKVIEDYNKTIVKLDEEYKKQKLKLHEWEKKKVKKIVEETHNDPEGRTAQIASEFGFELVHIHDDATG